MRKDTVLTSDCLFPAPLEIQQIDVLEKPMPFFDFRFKNKVNDF